MFAKNGKRKLLNSCVEIGKRNFNQLYCRIGLL